MFVWLLCVYLCKLWLKVNFYTSRLLHKIWRCTFFLHTQALCMRPQMSVWQYEDCKRRKDRQDPRWGWELANFFTKKLIWFSWIQCQTCWSDCIVMSFPSPISFYLAAFPWQKQLKSASSWWPPSSSSRFGAALNGVSWGGSGFRLGYFLWRFSIYAPLSGFLPWTWALL